jgi:MFS transporter, PPP family, 3-phenylpropionic acid transporter
MRWLRTIYLTNGAIFGTWGAFGAAFFHEWHGWDPSLVATTASLGSLVFWFALPVWGHLGDTRFGPRRAMQLAAIPAAVFLFLMVLPAPAPLIILFALGGSATGGSISAMTDAQAVSGLSNPRRDYGRLRMLGSLSAGLVTLVAGVLYQHTGYFLAPVLGALCTFSVVVSAGRLPQWKGPHAAATAAAVGPAAAGCEPEAVPETRPEPTRTHGRFGSTSDALHGRPRLVAILVGCLGIFIGIMGAGTFVTLKLQMALGADAQMIGLANGLGATAEVPAMIVAGWLCARFGIRFVLGMCGFGMVAMVCVWGLAADPLTMVAAKVVAGFCFAGITVGFVVTMATILPARLVSTGQTLYQSVAFGGGSILANMAGGQIYKLGGFNAVFWFLACAAAVGSVIVLLAVPGHSKATLDEVEAEAEAAPVEALPVAGA